MSKVVYICNYMLEDIMSQRNNKNVFSQAENNKVKLIYDSLRMNNCEVEIISHGKVNNKTMKKYKGFKSDFNNDVNYVGIIDFPVLNIISSIYYGYKEIKRINSKKKISNIIFYNYRPECAITAYLAKKILHIPIILEYEDGYYNLKEISNIKRYIYNFTEYIVRKSIDGAILVTSKLKNRINTKYVIVRGVVNQDIIEKSKIKKKNEVPVVMYSGGLEEVRGINILLDALKYTKSEFKLIITGKGECETDVIKNKDKRIEYLGYIEYKDMINKMINSDILISCQLQNNSFGVASFPSKIFEYSSTGNLIISSNVSDIEEFMGDIITIYNNDNPIELANKIDLVLSMISDNRKMDKIKMKMDKFNENNSPISIGKVIYNRLLKRD